MKRSDCQPHACAACTAGHSGVFADLAPREMALIDGVKGCRRYAKGEMIFHVDEYPPGLYCVHSGKVKIFKVGKDGREQIVRLAKEGDIIGYRSLISGERYSAYAVPMEDSDICLIPKDTFLSILTSSSTLSTRMLSLLSHDLKTAEERLVEMAQKPVRERVAETLLLLKETYGVEPDGATLNIRLTRAELATLVGTATESVSRMLSKLQQERTIDMHGRTITITNPGALTIAANIGD
ncbi:MAG TPA: Crp/Fnr family transcriptional regulator [Candidatus Kapabacteria bacterium]|nr:Crp/Fnr family transcriptional regulator [Candidatus Kapabacteria bacterium]